MIKIVVLSIFEWPVYTGFTVLCVCKERGRICADSPELSLLAGAINAECPPPPYTVLLSNSIAVFFSLGCFKQAVDLNIFIHISIYSYIQIYILQYNNHDGIQKKVCSCLRRRTCHLKKHCVDRYGLQRIKSDLCSCKRVAL